MNTKMIALVLALLLGLALVGCSAETPDAEAPGDAAGDAAGGLRLANGLYDQEDGSVIALGVLEWIDLEGGFYALTGSPEGDGNIAVIANADEFTDELEGLTGKTVQVTGTRLDGASIRMAGPEITIESIEEISDTPGAAE
ncbi:MAG: hypothetical protein ACYCXR_09165 [Coriobacteriia bacterium]